MADWDKRFIELARHVAAWSKDRSKKVGSVIVDDDKRVISMGYNGFPQHCNDDIEERHQKPLKLFYVVHAEANALYSANRSGVKTKGTTIYITFPPCSECAKGIIQSGIKRVVCCPINSDKSSWVETTTVGKKMLEEAGIEIKYIVD